MIITSFLGSFRCHQSILRLNLTPRLRGLGPVLSAEKKGDLVADSVQSCQLPAILGAVLLPYRKSNPSGVCGAPKLLYHPSFPPYEDSELSRPLASPLARLIQRLHDASGSMDGTKTEELPLREVIAGLSRSRTALLALLALLV